MIPVTLVLDACAITCARPLAAAGAGDVPVADDPALADRSGCDGDTGSVALDLPLLGAVDNCRARSRENPDPLPKISTHFPARRDAG